MRKERKIFGKHPVGDLISANPGRIVKILLQTNLKGSDLEKRCEAEEIPIEWVRKEKLAALAGSEVHQGVVAVVKDQGGDFGTFLQKVAPLQSGVVVVLDSIQDPQNVGSILRSSDFFGALGALYSTNRGSPITGVVAKASAGASEIIETVGVSNLAQAIEKLKDAGFWIVVTAVDEGAQSLYSVKFPEKIALVVGSEDKGVQSLLQRRADFRVFVPRIGSVESLNVGQATAVVLAEYSRQNSGT